MVMPSTEKSDGVVVTAIPGSSVIGFMAACGLLRTLGRAGLAARLAWAQTGRGWRAVIDSAGDSAEAVAAVVHSRLSSDGLDPLATIADADGSAPMTPERFAALYRQADADEDDELCAALDAYGAAARVDAKATSATAFRLTSGQQVFARFIRDIRGRPSPAEPPDPMQPDGTVGTTQAALVRALSCDPWPYIDPEPSLRWDERDLRLRAYRAHDPSDGRADPIRTVRGAVRLAIESLAWLPTIETASGVRTRGWVASADGPAVRWPLWGTPLSVSETRALVGSPAVNAESPDDAALRSLGVIALWHSRRGKVDRYGGMLAASLIWAA